MPCIPKSERLLADVLLIWLLITCQSIAQQSNYKYDQPGNLTSVTGTNAFAPSISTQPQSTLLYSNNPVSLSVVASGAGISYQWLSNGVPIIGATNDTLLFAKLNGTNASFSVIISNTSGSITSAPAAIWLDSRGLECPTGGS
jgi:hypothetical protein